MTSNKFITDAKVMSKGQVTIPKKVREALGITTGDRVTFIVNGSDIRIMNSTLYALEQFQKQMQGEADKAGLYSEEEVAKWITQSREKDKEVSPMSDLQKLTQELLKDKKFRKEYDALQQERKSTIEAEKNKED